jgi:hypothetical protein
VDWPGFIFAALKGPSCDFRRESDGNTIHLSGGRLARAHGRLGLPQQLRQLGDIGGDPSRIVAGEQVGRLLIVRLRHEAARRDVPVGRLIRDLLDTIVHDQLMAAILDDGDLPGA